MNAKQVLYQTNYASSSKSLSKIISKKNIIRLWPELIQMCLHSDLSSCEQSTHLVMATDQNLNLQLDNL